MLAYHNSVFLLFAVHWFAFASGFTGRISKRWTTSSVIFAGVLNLSQDLFIYFCTYCTNVYHRDTNFHVLSEIWCYVFLLETVFIRRQHFMHYLGRMQYRKSLVILIKSTLFNRVLYFSFANVFFPSKFPHIRQRISRFVQCGSRKDMQLVF